MRIGVVTTSYPRAPGDPAGAWVAEHAAWLAGQGHEVEVIAAGDGAPGAGAPGDAAGEGVAVTRIASRLFYRGGAPERLLEGQGGALAAARFSVALLAAIARRARRWDAAVAHWLLPSALAVRLVAPRLPLVAIAHSGDVHLAVRAHLAAPLALALGGARLVFVSRALRDRMAAALPARLGRRVAGAAIQPMGLDVAALARHAVAEPPATVVFLGRLVPIKGVDLLIAAAARLRAGARVVIAGDGPEAAGLRARAAATELPRGVALDFVGEVRGEARDRLLGGAAVVALPSRPVGRRVEGSPRVALEAMAAGAALVAARVGGLAELPAAAVSLVPPDDPGALAAAIDHLLTDRVARAGQVAAGRRHAAAHDWSRVGPRLAPW